MSKIFFSFFIIFFYEINSFSKENNPKSRKLKEIIEDLNDNDDDKDDIIILHTNDVHCGLIDNIGYDGLMLYKKELQDKYSNILIVDSGDHIQGDTIGTLSKGQDIINIMNKVGYDVVTIGNHEFDYGLDSLLNCNKNLSSKYISTNFCYKKNETNIFKQHKIIEIGNKKIAFLGLTTPQALTKTYLNKIVENGEPVYDFWASNGEQQFYKKVQEYIDNIINNNEADYIIILSHLGNEPSNKYTSSSLISNINNITAVLDGHSHEYYNKTVKDKSGKNVPLAQAGTKLNYLSVLKIKADGNVTSELISEIPKPKNTTGAILTKRNNKNRWVDEQMNNYTINIINSHNDELNELIGFADFNLIINLDENKDNQISRSEESTLGDLITDAIRNEGNSSISIMSAGSIRTDLYEGNITYKNIVDILPFFNDIIVKEVTGQNILDAIEYGMRNLPQKSARFPQVSGISFKVDITFDSTVEVDENEMFVKVKGDRRVYDAKIGNEKINPNKNYTISFDNYIGEGGDGYTMFRNKEEIYNTLKPDNETLINYIKGELNGIIPSRYNSTQGRIIINSNNNDSKAFIIALVVIFIVIVIFFIIIIICVKIKKNNFIDKISIEMENTNNEIYQE